MIIQRLHQEIKSSTNKLDSNSYRDLPPEIIDDIVNFCQNRYTEDLAFGYNKSGYNYGFEVDGQRLDMLQTLVVPTTLSPASTIILGTELILHSFNLPEDYRHYARINYNTTCKLQPVEIVQHGQLDALLKDEYKKPSLIWQRALGVIKNKQLNVYAPETIAELNLDYIKNPRPVFFGGYNTLEFDEGDVTAYNAASTPVTSEIPESYHYLLVDLCAQEIYKRFLTKEN